MSKLESEFKFEIGDIVKHIGVLDGSSRLVVIEQVAARCHGGTQMFYHCREVGRSVSEKIIRFNETEVAALNDDDLAMARGPWHPVTKAARDMLKKTEAAKTSD